MAIGQKNMTNYVYAYAMFVHARMWVFIHSFIHSNIYIAPFRDQRCGAVKSIAYYDVKCHQEPPYLTTVSIYADMRVCMNARIWVCNTMRVCR